MQGLSLESPFCGRCQVTVRILIEFHLKWFTMGVYDLATTIPYPESM